MNVTSARRAVPLFVVPNHRLTAIMPFILKEELELGTKLRMYLLQQNLILDGWKYESPIAIPIGGSNILYFFAGLSHPYLGYLILEIPYHDISALPRIEYNMKFLGRLRDVSFLFFTDRDLFSNLQDACWQNGCSRQHTVLALMMIRTCMNRILKSIFFTVNFAPFGRRMLYET